jgi:predicted ATP-grasp superfamily ATP-dependent carboligase
MRYTTFAHRPKLRRPILIAAFEGWNDAGEAATAALGFIASSLDAETIGHLDPEEFYDFQQTRPTVRLVGGTNRQVDWPSVQIQAVTLPQAERDLVLVHGHEPNLRWRSFATEVLAIARTLGAELLVTLGALLADVPHTRPVQVVGSTGDRALAEQLGLAASRYAGPTGVLGVLGEAARKASLPSISLWAALPHYVQASPNPQAALALVTKVKELLPMPIGVDSLERAASAFQSTVAELISEDPELAGYVERLEAEADREEDDDGASLAEVPPEQFVEEVERFLRDQPGGPRS